MPALGKTLNAEFRKETNGNESLRMMSTRPWSTPEGPVED